MNKYFYAFHFTLTTCSIFGQVPEDLKLPEPKRFIDKIEVFAGPNLSFNYGNKFIENYKDDNVTNKRLLKPGYTFGLGICHPLTNRIDLNIRLQYEQKGTKNELNIRSIDIINRQIMLKNYTYRYLNVLLAPQLFIDRHKRILLSAGLYYSKIWTMNGYEKIYETRDGTTNEGHFKGRFFNEYHYDGIQMVYSSFAWMPYLTSIQDYDWGLVTSIGYKIPFKEKHSMLIQLQDNLGLKDINKNNPYGLKEKNHSLSLIIGYTYYLPPKSLRL